MPAPRTLADLETPAAVVDLDRMSANLDRMSAYVRERGLSLRPHTKTHKNPDRAADQLRRGAVGVTVATPFEAETMARVADDVLVAYPPVGRARLERLLALPGSLRLTVALDSDRALDDLAVAAAAAGRAVGVLVELDVGMGRCGVSDPADAVALARRAADAAGVAYGGVIFYPGHIRAPVREQDAALEELARTLERHIAALASAGLEPATVSGGSTPTAFRSHELPMLTEIRPGTYIYNDRTTAAIGACAWDDCAYTILATVVSTAVGGQAVVDAGSKALSSEVLRAQRFADASGLPAATSTAGLGALLDRPDVVVRATSEEHGILDLSGTDWRPRVGDRVRVVPNHVCVSVNLHDRVVGARGEAVEEVWPVTARGHRPREADRVAAAAVRLSATRARGLTPFRR